MLIDIVILAVLLSAGKVIVKTKWFFHVFTKSVSHCVVFSREERERERQRETERDRERQRQRGRQTDRQTVSE